MGANRSQRQSHRGQSRSLVAEPFEGEVVTWAGNACEKFLLDIVSAIMVCRIVDKIVYSISSCIGVESICCDDSSVNETQAEAGQIPEMTESLRQKIYQSIRDDITYGKLFPGERLVESQLADKFKASRSPIREAIRQLEGEGLLRLNQNKGITVSRLSIKEVDEIYNLRCLLESYAARLSAEQVTKAQIIYLRDLHEKLKVAGENSDLSSWIHNNILFHDFFSENSGNANLHQILVHLKRRVYLYHYIIVSIPGNFEVYIDHHEEILRACKKNDGEMAEKYMKLHVESVKQVLINHLDKFHVF